MLSLINDNRSLLEEHDFPFVATSPLLYQCHHFNLFFEQTIDDALGVERGTQVRTQAAYEASSQFLNALISAIPPTTPEERLDLAVTVFSVLGQGTLELDVAPSGGKAIGRHLHYGSSWKEKYGARLERRHPADAVTAGYIAAATEAAYGLPLGSIECVETGCLATGQEHCEFEIRESGEDIAVFGVTKGDIVAAIPRPLTGAHEDTIRQLATTLREFTSGLSGDKRGLIESFGILVTQQLANYYNHCVNRTLDIIVEEKSGVVNAARELLRECGQVGGFHTFGGVLSSPEWEAMIGPMGGEPKQVINSSLAVARAMGFGRWALEKYEPGNTLILRSPATYESVYRKASYPIEEGGVCYFYQGAALGIMQLAHLVTWADKPSLSNSSYLELRRQVPWRVEETHCVAAGNSVCRVVVE